MALLQVIDLAKSWCAKLSGGLMKTVLLWCMEMKSLCLDVGLVIHLNHQEVSTALTVMLALKYMIIIALGWELVLGNAITNTS